MNSTINFHALITKKNEKEISKQIYEGEFALNDGIGLRLEANIN